MGGQALVVLTTLANGDAARKLVRTLLDNRLIACGTVLPGAVSIFRWKGTVSEEEEVVVLLKTDASRWDALAQAVRQHHPYDVPELLALPVLRGLDRYLAWVSEEVGE